jgi:hypothetical protein
MLKKRKIEVKDQLRLRVVDLKSRFKGNVDYTTLYQYEFGEQDNRTVAKIRAVWNLRETDELITSNLEKIAAKYKAAK